MPNCFQLIRKSDPQAGPVSLSLIDEEMCKHFGVTPDPVQYYCEWFNWIGFRLAMGRSLEYLRGYFNGASDFGPKEDDRMFDELSKITKWLDENFTSDAFYQRK